MRAVVARAASGDECVAAELAALINRAYAVSRGPGPTRRRSAREWYTRLGYSVVRTVPFEAFVPQAAPFLSAPGDVLVFAKTLHPPTKGV